MKTLYEVEWGALPDDLDAKHGAEDIEWRDPPTRKPSPREALAALKRAWDDAMGPPADRYPSLAMDDTPPYRSR